MPLSSGPAFGRYSPAALICSLILCAQRCPHNWLGQQIAQVIRLVVLAITTTPMDVHVGAIRMRCHMRDNCSEKKFTFMPWRFDLRERQLLLEALPRDGVFVDVGANVGIYTLTAATHLGRSGHVIALEPSPAAFRRLSFNVAATKTGSTEWPRITMLELGAGETTAENDLYLSPDNLGASSIVPVDWGQDWRTQPKVCIACKPLIQILAELSVVRIDALKIDIEGAEDLVLMPFLREAPADLLPRLMIVENSERRWKQDLPGMLASRGYVVSLRTRMNTVFVRGAASARTDLIPS